MSDQPNDGDGKVMAATSLIVEFGTTANYDDLPGDLPACWYVEAPAQDPTVIMRDFQRRQDAEIAARVLPDTGLDFDAPQKEFARQWDAFGGRAAIRKFVCERLQW